MLAPATFEDFEATLEAVIDGIADPVNRGLMREHFAFDEPSGKRGKRLRPRMTVAVARAEGAPPERAFPAAIAVELLHNFSLIHDDIEDRDEIRHGRPTLWVRFGIPAALGAGDAMCALAYTTLLDGCAQHGADRCRAMARCLLHAHHEMTKGQAYDIGFEDAARVTFDEYVTMIGCKTAAVFGASCELWALVAGASEERAAAYGRVGRAYGLAFQVRDDILGSWGDEAQTGKPSGADVRRRKWSFPVAWAMSRPPSPDRDMVASEYRRHEPLDDVRVGYVLEALARLGAREAADAECARYIAEAHATAAAHGLDSDADLAALLDSTAKRVT